MASQTDLVARIGEAGTIPANRPIDHARRIVTAMAIGAFLGVLFGFLLFASRLSITAIGISFLPFMLLVIAVVVVWKIPTGHGEGQPIPVIARTLATDESPYARYVRKGANRGLLVPVVVLPVDGGDPFRSVILLRETQSGREVEDPGVGTLIALQQDHPGMGELSNIDRVTPEQVALREKLLRHPRLLSNRAPTLPMRRGALERAPWWAAAQWWGGLFGMTILMLVIMRAMSL
ncbi:hypothetical protein [Trueperella sp. LYQ143]|uniref:hypothetical protein n=1 Tax=unclassified Trueperella TaxID=2630174 RepID=UPI00398304F3